MVACGTILTFALFIVGDHHSVKRLFGIWFKPDLCAFVSFLYFIDSSKPLAFSLKTKNYFALIVQFQQY